MQIQSVHLRGVVLAAIIGTLLSACGAIPTPVASVPSSVAAPSATLTSGLPSANAVSAPATSSPTRASVVSTAVATVAPTAFATPSPVAAPTATAAPVASAVPSPIQGFLPAPLLFLRAGQIVRMERDGTTIVPMTHEQPGQPDILAVINFDVSPVDGSIVYVVQGAGGNLLVRADARGQQRTVLLNKVPVNNPRWSPDGSQIAVQIAEPADSAGGPIGGVYLIAANGGDLQLLQSNDRNDPANPSADAYGYLPQAWSPDGKRLLLSAYSLTAKPATRR
jgi:hypothetical protein